MRPDHPLLLHGLSVPTRGAWAPERGIWCEWRHADGQRIRSAALRTPESAVRWARINVRVIASAVDEVFLDPLVDRSYQDWCDAACALTEGEDFTLPLVAEPYSSVWHPRPALFLPLVGGIPTPHMPEGGALWD